jgi:hypothetical protein
MKKNFFEGISLSGVPSLAFTPSKTTNDPVDSEIESTQRTDLPALDENNKSKGTSSQRYGREWQKTSVHQLIDQLQFSCSHNDSTGQIEDTTITPIRSYEGMQMREVFVVLWEENKKQFEYSKYLIHAIDIGEDMEKINAVDNTHSTDSTYSDANYTNDTKKIYTRLRGEKRFAPKRVVPPRHLFLSRALSPQTTCPTVSSINLHSSSSSTPEGRSTNLSNSTAWVRKQPHPDMEEDELEGEEAILNASISKLLRNPLASSVVLISINAKTYSISSHHHRHQPLYRREIL